MDFDELRTCAKILDEAEIPTKGRIIYDPETGKFVKGDIMNTEAELRLEAVREAVKCQNQGAGFENVVKNAREIYKFCKETTGGTSPDEGQTENKDDNPVNLE